MMDLTDEELANLVNVDGHWVDKDLLGIVEQIQAYDPNLKVQYLEGLGKINEPPWRIVEKCKDGVDRVVLTAWQLDHSVLTKLYFADTHKHDVGARVEETNKKVKEEIKKKHFEEIQESGEVAAAIVTTNKADYSVRDPRTGELLTFMADGTVKRGRSGYTDKSQKRIRR